MPKSADISPVEKAIAFLERVEHKRRREDALTLLPLMCEWTGMEPALWTKGDDAPPSSGIVGFGNYHYKYASGREGDWYLTGFSPRKANLAIYIMPGFKTFEEPLSRLGPHKHSVSCLYLTNLAKVDLSALGEIVRDSIEIMKERYEWLPTGRVR